MYNEKNCTKTMYEGTESNVGKIAIIKESFFKPEFRKPEYQLFRIEGGFGAEPTKMGNAVFGSFCVDGEKCRIERYDFIGIADKETEEVAKKMEEKRK